MIQLSCAAANLNVSLHILNIPILREISGASNGEYLKPV
jgi:hypothetical protein